MSNNLNLVTNEELKDIQNSFNKVISWVDSIEAPNTDELFQKWLEAKSSFISSFGGLIYTYPQKVSFKINTDGKKKYFSRLRDLISGLVAYNTADIDSQILSWFDDTVTPDSLFENITTENYVFKSKFLDKRILIPKGSKVIKAFKHFFNSKELLSYVQNFSSEFIQKNKIEGYLCASVHPLDFLSLSENTYNWHTCHSLDGGFRAGNLSYMTDSSTFIIYLRSEQLENTLPGFPKTVQWNSKKWRMLMFLSDDYQMMFAGRQYPFECDNVLSNFIDDLLVKAKIINEKDTNWTKWTQDRYIGEEDNFITKPLYPIGDLHMVTMDTLVHEREYPLEFNDLLHSTEYIPYWKARCSAYGILNNIKSRFNIGSEVTCLKCGKRNIHYSEAFLCDKCLLEGDITSSSVLECERCGKRVLYDNVVFVPQGTGIPMATLCEKCWSKDTVKCDKCGGYFLKEDLIEEPNLNGTFKKICFLCSKENIIF